MGIATIQLILSGAYYIRVLEENVTWPLLRNINDILRNHIKYHHSSRNGVQLNYIVESVLGPERATNL